MPSDRSILIVDDDPNLRQSLGLILRTSGYAVDAAENAQTCLLRLETRSFDLMILDQKMPDMNGMTLLTVVRHRFPSLPVLFLTGNGSSELEKRVLSDGAMGYLVKPVEPEAILDLVRSICPKDASA
jgi:DNA-binding response OmpR family regulator